MMAELHCSACGAQLRPEARFCPRCGQAVTYGAPIATHDDPHFTTLFETLVRTLRSLADQVRPLDETARCSLALALEQLTHRDVTITFGGAFKAGKSSLLNALLDRDILPVNNLPETGVSCVLESGLRDTACLIDCQGRHPLACTPQALEQIVACVTANGEYNTALAEIQRVEITLYDAPIPPHVHWIDTPGINDTEQMTARALEAARAADVLVWVLSSKQFLAESEQAYLAQFIAERGPAAVLFVLNVFLPHDSPAEWQTFCTAKLPAHQKKLLDRAATLGLDGHFRPWLAAMSARARDSDGRHPSERQVKSLIMALSSEDHPLVRRARLFRILPLLQQTVTALEGQARGLTSRAEQYQAQLAAAQRYQQFIAAVNAAFETLVQDCQTYANNRAQEIAARITKDTLTTLETRTTELNQALQQSLTTALERFLAAQRDLVRRWAQPSLSEEAERQFRSAWQAPAVKINMGAYNRQSGTIGGAGAGAAIGSMLFPGVGTIIGGIVGAVAGATKDVEADNKKQVAHAQQSVLQAVQVLVDDVKQYQAEAVAFVTAPATAADQGVPEAAAQATLAATRADLDQALTTARACLQQVITLAWQEVSPSTPSA